MRVKCNACWRELEGCGHATQCGHVFCEGCVVRVERAHNCCPVCKTPVAGELQRVVVSRSARELCECLVGLTPEEVATASEAATAWYFGQKRVESDKLNEVGRRAREKTEAFKKMAERKLMEYEASYLEQVARAEGLEVQVRQGLGRVEALEAELERERRERRRAEARRGEAEGELEAERRRKGRGGEGGRVVPCGRGYYPRVRGASPGAGSASAARMESPLYRGGGGVLAAAAADAQRRSEAGTPTERGVSPSPRGGQGGTSRGHAQRRDIMQSWGGAQHAGVGPRYADPLPPQHPPGRGEELRPPAQQQHRHWGPAHGGAGGGGGGGSMRPPRSASSSGPPLHGDDRGVLPPASTGERRREISQGGRVMSSFFTGDQGADRAPGRGASGARRLEF